MRAIYRGRCLSLRLRSLIVQVLGWDLSGAFTQGLGLGTGQKESKSGLVENEESTIVPGDSEDPGHPRMVALALYTYCPEGF